MSTNPFEQFNTPAEQPEVPKDPNPFAQFNTPAVPALVEEPQTESGFFSRSLDELKGLGEINTTFDKYGDGSIPKSPAQVVVGEAADVLQAGSNILVDGGLTMLDTLMPDVWQEAVKDFSREKWDMVLANPVAQKGLEAAKSGLETYNAWAKENPDWAESLEDIVSITPLARAANFRPRGETYIRKLNKEGDSNKKRRVFDMLRPVNKDLSKDKYFENDKGVIIWDPSTWTREIIDETTKVEGVSPNRSFVHNINALEAAVDAERKSLDARIAKSEKPINLQSVKTGLANKVNNLESETLLVGDALTTGMRVYKRAAQLLDESDGTALGVLNARRKLDEWVRGQSNVYDAAKESATSIALKDIRGYLNDVVSDNVKSARVKQSLTKQHKLLTATDMLLEKAAREADTRFGRLIQKIENETTLKLPTTPLAQAATIGAAGTAVGMGGGAGLAVAGGLGAVLAGYKGGKWLFSPDGKRWLANAMVTLDSNPVTRPEAIALQQLVQGLEQPEEKE